MNSRSFSASNHLEVSQQLEQLKSEGFIPTVAIVFASVSHNFNDISSIFNQYNIDLVGCSSAGEINKDTVHKESIVVLAMDMKAGYYKVQSRDTQSKTTFEIAKELGNFAKESFTNPAILAFTGGIQNDAEQAIFGLKAGAGKELPIYGAAAGDDLKMTDTFVFSNNWTSNDGLLCMVIDTDKMNISGMATSGWEPIGTTNKITKSEGNIVYAINDKPALDVFIDYFGFVGNDANGQHLETISGQYPLQIIREGGYSILRSPLIGNEENRSLVLAGGVKEGDEFKFSTSPGFEVAEKTIADFKLLKDRAAHADAMVLISCKGRHGALGPIIEDEIKGVYNYWKAPMVGLFSYGEIGNSIDGTCEFHNETCVMVILSEK